MTLAKKICLLGASAVGKTSLVRRFVHNKYEETYRTTLGGRRYDKTITCAEKQVAMVIQDLEGMDDPGSKYSMTSLDGVEGYMLVTDVTRPDTLDVVKSLLEIIESQRKEDNRKGGLLVEASKKDDLPFVLLINKQDILKSLEVTNHAYEIFGDNTNVFETSAKTGERVNEAFECLAKQMFDDIQLGK